MENPFDAILSRFDRNEAVLAEILKNLPRREEKLHSVKSLAEFADVSELTIRNHIDKGKIKAVRIGSLVRIPESQFLNGLEDVKSLKYQR